VQTRTHISSGPGRSSVACTRRRRGELFSGGGGGGARSIGHARGGHRGRCSPTHLLRPRRRFSGPPQPRSGPFPPNTTDATTRPLIHRPTLSCIPRAHGATLSGAFIHTRAIATQ